MDPETLTAMRQSIVDGAPDSASTLARNALQAGIPPLEIIDAGYLPAMAFVGEQYAQRKMFLPDMLASAEAMKAAMTVLESDLKQHGQERPMTGTVIPLDGGLLRSA